MVTGISDGYNNYTAGYTNQTKRGSKQSEEKRNITDDTNSGNVKEYAQEGVTLELSGSSGMEFTSTRDLLTYLSENYAAVGKGMVKISGSYLRECLEDEDKRQQLFDMLETADAMEADAQENVKGYQGMKITIDEDGNMETETCGGSVTFNEAKRARQLASAKSAAQVRVVLNLLNQDLSDCQNGVSSGMCDEAEVAKVRAMLQQAMQQMNQLSNSEDEEKDQEQGFDSFAINMLM